MSSFGKIGSALTGRTAGIIGLANPVTMPSAIANLVGVPNYVSGLTPKTTGQQVQYPGFDLASLLGMMPSFNVTPYTGVATVDMPQGLRQVLNRSSDLVTDPKSALNTALSGKPDFGQLQQAVIGPAYQQMVQQNIPQLASIYSGGPYGSANWGGQRAAAQTSLLNQFNQTASGLRYQATNDAKSWAMQAMQMLPAFAQTANYETQLAMYNVNNQMAVHYQNQGLGLQQYQADLQAVNAALGAAQFDFEKWAWQQSYNLQQQQLNQQQRAGLYGLVGGIGGGIAGATLGGPVGAMAGYSIGSGLGSSLGGSYSTGNSQINTGMNNYILMSMLNKQSPTLTNTFSLPNSWKVSPGTYNTPQGNPSIAGMGWV